MPLALVAATQSGKHDRSAAEVRARRFTLVDASGAGTRPAGFHVQGSSRALEPELWIGEDQLTAGGPICAYGRSTRAQTGAGFVNLNVIGLRIVLHNVEIDLNTGLGGGPHFGLRGRHRVSCLRINRAGRARRLATPTLCGGW
jgi:hypothetical protein